MAASALAVAVVFAGAAVTAALGARTLAAQAPRRAASTSADDSASHSAASHSAAPRLLRTIAIDERLRDDHDLALGDTVFLSASPSDAGAWSAADTVGGEWVVVGAIVRRGADPSEVARGEYRIRLHLGQLQALTGAGDRVDRFAVQVDSGKLNSAIDAINARAFGFRAHRAATVAAGSSRTFAVVSRFNRAIGVITIVASAIFLLCIMLLKVEERRRDVAALRLLGISSTTVTRAVVLEASCIALLGSAAGVAFGYVSSRIINVHYRGVYRTPLAFSLVTPETVAFAVALSLALGIGAGYLAARRLTSVPPLSLFGR